MTNPLFISASLAALALGGCTIPHAGPSISGFNHANSINTIDLIDASAVDAQEAQQAGYDMFPEQWKHVRQSEYNRIGARDSLRVTIFERDDLGVFPAGNGGGSASSGLNRSPLALPANRSGGSDDGGSTFPSVAVDDAGMIQLPYVGRVPVLGLSLEEARLAISRKVNRLTLSSDVTVSFADRHSQTVSVQGDVTRPGIVPLTSESSRLTSLLSVAAPNPADLEVAYVTVRRGMESATVRLSDVFEQPSEDITLRSDDVVIVRNMASTVKVMGAAGAQGRIRISKAKFSVVDAVMDAHGLNDDTANPKGVYLMRLSAPSMINAATPRVYHFDFSDPSSLAIASSFPVREGDAVVISNAVFAQAAKVLAAFHGGLSTASEVKTVAP